MVRKTTAKIPPIEVDYYISVACGQVICSSILHCALKSINMNYQEFKEEYLELCQIFGRDTKRKIKNDLKKDITEYQYRIEYIEPKILSRGACYLYGELYTRTDLNKYKKDLEFSKQLISEL